MRVLVAARWVGVLVGLSMLVGGYPTTMVSAEENGVRIVGVVESLPAAADRVGEWRVSGRTVHVTTATHINQEHGAPAVGVVVEVGGHLQSDGSLEALEIAVKAPDGLVQVVGPVESLPETSDRVGPWTVGGRTVHVTAATTLQRQNGQVAVGVVVRAVGTLRADSSLEATRIEVLARVEPVKLTGYVERLPDGSARIGEWKVDGKVVRVTSTTRINQEVGPVAVGVLVEVEGARRTDGSLDAATVVVKSRKETIKIGGVIERLPEAASRVGEWKVGGHTVRVTAATVIDDHNGAVGVGAAVEVEGTRRGDGSLDATKIVVKSRAGGRDSLEFRGAIERLPSNADLIGDWRVAGKTLHVTSSTRVKQARGAAVVGAIVEVKGTKRSDGSVDATEIVVTSRENRETGLVRFSGKIERLPSSTNLVGDWTVGGKTIHVATTTPIKQEGTLAAVGASVEGVGRQRADGSIDAIKIEVKR